MVGVTKIIMLANFKYLYPEEQPAICYVLKKINMN